MNTDIIWPDDIFGFDDVPVADDITWAVVVFAIIIIPLGIWFIVSPYSAWRFSFLLRHWWDVANIDDVEPTDFSLVMYRICGGAIIVMSIIFALAEIRKLF